MKRGGLKKLLKEYCIDEMPINLNSLRNTMRANKIRYKLFRVDKAYIEGMHRISNPMIYYEQLNYEIRIQNWLTIDYFVLVPIDGPQDVNCLIIYKEKMKKVFI